MKRIDFTKMNFPSYKKLNKMSVDDFNDFLHEYLEYMQDKMYSEPYRIKSKKISYLWQRKKSIEWVLYQFIKEYGDLNDDTQHIRWDIESQIHKLIFTLEEWIDRIEKDEQI